MKHLTALAITLTAFACQGGGKDDTDATGDDTDVTGDDTDVVGDTDVGGTGCDAPDACDGCQADGDTISCDCSWTVADDASTCRAICLSGSCK